MSRAGKGLRALAAAAVLCGTAIVAAPANAADPPPEVLTAAGVVIVDPLHPDTARIVGVYRCFGGQPIHLWVSAKQGGPDPSAEGAGGTPAAQGGAVAWYDTNIITPAPVACDGHYHSAIVKIGQHPEKALLTGGTAWIQFCLVAPDPNNPNSEFGIVASQQKFGRVVGVI